MSKRTRLVFLFLSLVLLVVVGFLTTGSLTFFLEDFWFTAGLFMLILLSVIDQPFFSTDANIFANGVTGWVSLLMVRPPDRDGVWWLFLTWSGYLVVSSYILMWIRSRKLGREPRAVQLVSRVNRQIGRPEALFSAFFLWGCLQQFGTQSPQFNALLLYWVVFMILNLPAVAHAIDQVLSDKRRESESRAGTLLHVLSPRIAEAALSPELPRDIVGHSVNMMTRNGQVAGTGVIVDDRVIAGQRIGRLAITTSGPAWTQISGSSGEGISIQFADDAPTDKQNESALSVVDAGSEIGKLVFSVHPDATLGAGHVVWTDCGGGEQTYYQIVAGQVSQTAVSEGNCVQNVKVTAGQLGRWDETNCRFEPVPWVAPAGQLVFRSSLTATQRHVIPQGHVSVGKVPNSDFPVHMHVGGAVTHNTAIIGVTGSGKSYLAYHLVEAMISEGIKVLVLDLSREHYVYLKHLDPVQLTDSSKVAGWLTNGGSLGLHQYAQSQSYPNTTADFVQAAFAELSKTQLTAGVNVPAKLCVVLEEAHSLVPEWNQVAQQTDVQQVNRTARAILQGRKYGMGCLLITQRTANVTKTILNQCNTILALQSFDQTGLDFLKNYMGEEYAHAISTLPARQAILVGKASSSARPVMVTIDDFGNRWQSI